MEKSSLLHLATLESLYGLKINMGIFRMAGPAGFGMRLREARGKAMFTQPGLAAAIAKRTWREAPYSSYDVAQWEGRTPELSLEVFTALVAVLQVSPNWLLTGANDSALLIDENRDEFQIINTIASVLSKVDRDARGRILGYVNSHLGDQKTKAA